MANEHWYILKVRSDFNVVVAQRLRKLNLDVFVPESNRPQEARKFCNYIYCRFDLQDREAILSVPGIVDILGTPEPSPIDGDLSPLRSLHFRP